MPEPPPLPPRERQIMDVLFASGPATVAEVRRRMADAPSDNAVRTFLTILERKGHVRRLKPAGGGRGYRWSAVARRDRAGRADLQRVVRTFFGGSLAKAFAAYLAEHKAELSEQELRELRDAIEKARKQGD